MALPVVVIVGRPNVGKSSLLNALARERISIVDPRAGTTRDRVSALIEHRDRYFELIDTGGVGVVDVDHLESHVEEQIRFALARADVVLFVVDAQDGLTVLDQRVAELLRRLSVPVMVVANKVDDPRHVAQTAEFIRLGHGEPLPASALHVQGREELLDRLVALLGERADGHPADPVMKLAIVGKRNAGKSTLVNALAGEERVIVSEVPGTTRDAVDVRFERDGRVFVAIDTAGVRKKRSMGDLDFYSYTRALRSIQRADVVLHLIDATVPVSEVDLKLARAILDAHKPLLLGINKWDLVGDRATSAQFGEYLARAMPMLPFAPIVLLTASTGRNVHAAIDVAQSLFNQANTRVGTGQLNAVLEKLLEARGPTARHGRKAVRIYYATQVGTAPPTIVCFCNDPSLVTDNYRRYLENRLRAALPYAEVPIRLLFRPRHTAPAGARPAAAHSEDD
ncbi:MAG: ribosome biogenesis GTPase Der [Phycisphaerae bacterium]|nr:ribosome biogenesis GTPase Der [Phycisphaerae bacterium]MCZ2401428.1 ribosome biogenesis GTPase Der [Phycisphaerae bacterium]NUQ49230.1 ribosome biogenesis GTPase Der [Phycisphaerae bacterium]